MRHDSHLVDEIIAPRSESVGRMIDIRRVEPNPHQPRKDFGDLTEMIASVKDKGILEPILVRGEGNGRYQIIAGERRYQAALQAGIQRVPCIEVDVDHRGMIEISLIENLQRKDLTPFEESAALQRLCDQFRYTHEEIARKLGKSRTVITESLSLQRLPEAIQERCRRADITSKSTLIQIARLESEAAMQQLIDHVEGGLTRDEARRFTRGGPSAARERSKRYTYRFRPDDNAFQFRLTFAKSDVDRTELIRALKQVLEGLVAENDAGASATSG